MGAEMPEHSSNTKQDVDALILGRDGTTDWCRVTLLEDRRCTIESDQIFQRAEEVEIHIRGSGLVRARVISVAGRVMTAEFIVDCPV